MAGLPRFGLAAFSMALSIGMHGIAHDGWRAVGVAGAHQPTGRERRVVCGWVHAF